MSEKPRFKIGQDIWFRYKQNRPAPVSVLGYGKKPKTYDICSLEGVFILQDVEEQYLSAEVTGKGNEAVNLWNRRAGEDK